MMAKGDKYALLYEYLKKQVNEECVLSFSEIENILGFFPLSAYAHRAWWANDFSHSQARAWLKNNMKIKTVEFELQKVTFIKNTTHVEGEWLKEDINTSTVYNHKAQKSKSTEVKKDNDIQLLDNGGTIPIADNSQNIRLKKDNRIHSLDDSRTIQKIDNSKNIRLKGYAFFEVEFLISQMDIHNTFLGYKGKTVECLLNRSKYSSLKSEVQLKYSRFLFEDISVFMQYLIENEDEFYLRFLNKNGSDPFCVFKLCNPLVYNLKGLYIYLLDGELKYIGRCRDSFYQRFNINYGKISPLNCYKEGQSTNTHMNSLMNRYKNRISIYVCPITDINEITEMEKQLISMYKPEWNRMK